MAEQTKHVGHASVAAAKPEMTYELSAGLRRELRLDLRFLLRDRTRASTLRLLRMLLQTVEREPTRVRFPLEVLGCLADEIDQIAAILPATSPLLDLGERARARSREGDACRHVVPAAGKARVQDGALMHGQRSLVEETRFLRQAAAAVEVADVQTAELGEAELAGWMRCCMARLDYETVIGVLEPYVRDAPRLWAWNLLLAALRKSGHAGFKDAASRFAVWAARFHPHAVAGEGGRVDERRFSRAALGAIEKRELGCRSNRAPTAPVEARTSEGKSAA